MNGWLQRGVGLVIALAVLAAAGMLWFAIASRTPTQSVQPPSVATIGSWDVLFSLVHPSVKVIALALALAIGAVLAVSVVTWRTSTKSRTSFRSADYPLAARRIMELTRDQYAGPVTITVLIPAHNEQARISATLTSLRSQRRQPDRVIVIADNCSDDTVHISRQAGVEVIETLNNVHKKAGALNQVLEHVLPGAGDNDIVMVLDADTMLNADFLAVAHQHFTDDRALMAVFTWQIVPEGGFSARASIFS